MKECRASLSEIHSILSRELQTMRRNPDGTPLPAEYMALSTAFSAVYTTLEALDTYAAIRREHAPTS